MNVQKRKKFNSFDCLKMIDNLTGSPAYNTCRGKNSAPKLYTDDAAKQLLAVSNNNRRKKKKANTREHLESCD